MRQKTHEIMQRSLFRNVNEWASSFFLWFNNSRGDVWSRTALYWKPLGKTPLEAAEAFRTRGVYVYGRHCPIPAGVPIAYAGRLDPMAEGWLLLLVGEKCKELKKYTGVDKTYIVEVLLGVSTDTGDLLGKVTAAAPHVEARCDRGKVLKKFVGEHEWEYPVFSSKTVQGKPLFRWFYEGRIGEIEIPKRAVRIYTLQFKKENVLTTAELLAQVRTRIAQVTHVESGDKEWGKDFRRLEVLEQWDAVVQEKKISAQFCVMTIECRCSSGTYMRTLASKIGEDLGVPACAFSIIRTQIG